MRNIKKMFRAALPLAIVLVTACEETSGPNALDNLNTTRTLADYDAMESVRQSAGWRGFQMVAPQMAARTGIAPSGVARRSIPLISETNRGKTFIYDAARHEWVIDAART